MPDQNRLSLIDITRGIGIAFVVFGHNWIVLHEKGALFRLIFSFHMPLFFVLAGIFIRSSATIGRFALQRADSLLKPYFVVLGCILLKQRLHPGAGDSMSLQDVMYGTGAVITWSPPMWFLPHLAIASLVSLLLIKAVGEQSRRYFSWVSAVLLASGYAMLLCMTPDGVHVGPWRIPLNHGLPWSVDVLPITSAFIVFGYAWRDDIKDFGVQRTFLFPALLAFAACQVIFHETIDLSDRVYGQALVATAQALLGIYICLCLAKLASKHQILADALSYLGARSLFVLIFHWYFQYLVFALASRHISNPNFCGLLGFFAGIGIPLAIYEITRRIGILRILLLPLSKATRSPPDAA